MNIYESLNSHLRVSDLVDEVKSFVDDPKAWNDATDEERVNMVEQKCKDFVDKYKNIITYGQVKELLDTLQDDNFHTECIILYKLFVDEGLAD